MAEVATPGLVRRLASMLYDCFLLGAVLFVAAFLFVALTQGATSPFIRRIFQAYLLGCSAAYFLWFWLHGGQTLAMKTWRLRLVCEDGAPLSAGRAVFRFLLAIFSMGLGIGILWALFDPERLFLHDRLARTRIVGTNGD